MAKKKQRLSSKFKKTVRRTSAAVFMVAAIAVAAIPAEKISAGTSETYYRDGRKVIGGIADEFIKDLQNYQTSNTLAPPRAAAIAAPRPPGPAPTTHISASLVQ